MQVSHEMLEKFAGAARRAGGQGLMRCSSGNLSCRIDRETMLVKGSRAWMAELSADQVAVCRTADGVSLNGVTPSVEIGFHAGVLRARADVNVVLHFQTPAATTLACSQPLPDFFVIPEIPYYIGRIGVVPYLPPGSPQLAAAVTSAMADCDLALMTSHGQVTVGRDYDDAIQKAVFFELACEIILRGGERVRPLSPESVTAIFESRGKGKV